MLYEVRDGKVRTKAVEYSVSYHCNLRCSGCSHMSPFLKRSFPSLESFAADVEQLGKVLHAADIRLVGGEPLLNPQVEEFVKTAKRSGIADTVMVTTNGLLLHRAGDGFWENVDFVSVTIYPDAPPAPENVELFKERARASGTRLRLFPNPVFRTTIVTEPHPRGWVTDMIYRTCKNAHLYHCHMIHEGRLYKCAVPPFLPEYQRRIGMGDYDPAGDGYDIHAGGERLAALKAYLFSPRVLEACRWCLGHVGKFQEHHQLDPSFVKSPTMQRISGATHLDRYKLLKESVRYGRRRLVERVTGRPAW